MTEAEFKKRKRAIIDLHRRAEVLDAKPKLVIDELERFASRVKTAVDALGRDPVGRAARLALEEDLPNPFKIWDDRKKAGGLTDQNDPLLHLVRLARGAINGIHSQNPRLREKKNARGQDTYEARGYTITHLAELWREREGEEHATEVASLDDEWGEVDYPRQVPRYRKKRAELDSVGAYRERLVEFVKNTLEAERVLRPEQVTEATIRRQIPKPLMEPPWKERPVRGSRARPYPTMYP